MRNGQYRMDHGGDGDRVSSYRHVNSKIAVRARMHVDARSGTQQLLQARQDYAMHSPCGGAALRAVSTDGSPIVNTSGARVMSMTGSEQIGLTNVASLPKRPRR